MCLEISGGQRKPGSCDSNSREEVAVTWIGVGAWRVSTGWIWDALYTRPGLHGHSHCHPRSWGTLALRWAQSFLTLPVSHSRPSEEQCGLGVDSPGRLQGRKCQAMPWPQHPVIWSSPGLIIGWHALCPPSPLPHSAGSPAPSQESRRRTAGCLSVGQPASGGWGVPA